MTRTGGNTFRVDLGEARQIIETGAFPLVETFEIKSQRPRKNPGPMKIHPMLKQMWDLFEAFVEVVVTILEVVVTILEVVVTIPLALAAIVLVFLPAIVLVLLLINLIANLFGGDLCLYLVVPA